MNNLFVFLTLFGLSASQTPCGIGAQCATAVGVTTCSPCPSGTRCLASADGGDGFFCQYTTCLSQGMTCEENVGTCCGELQCGLLNAAATIKTCNNYSPSEFATTTAGIVIGTTPTTATATSTVQSGDNDDDSDEDDDDRDEDDSEEEDDSDEDDSDEDDD